MSLELEFKPKSLHVAYLLWLFGGLIGAQRLYIRHFAMAAWMTALSMFGIGLTFSGTDAMPFGLVLFALWAAFVIWDAVFLPAMVEDYNDEAEKVWHMQNYRMAELHGVAGAGTTRYSSNVANFSEITKGMNPATAKAAAQAHNPQPTPRVYDDGHGNAKPADEVLKQQAKDREAAEERRRRQRQQDDEDAAARRRRQDDDDSAAAASAALTASIISTDIGSSIGSFDSGSTGSFDAGGGSFGGGGADGSY